MNNKKLYQQMTWSQLEDTVLMQAVQKYGMRQWGAVQTLLSNKTVIQCQQRFYQLIHKGGNKKLNQKILEIFKETNNIQLTSSKLNISREYVYSVIQQSATKYEEEGITSNKDDIKMMNDINQRLMNQTSKFSRKHFINNCKIKKQLLQSTTNSNNEKLELHLTNLQKQQLNETMDKCMQLCYEEIQNIYTTKQKANIHEFD